MNWSEWRKTFFMTENKVLIIYQKFNQKNTKILIYFSYRDGDSCPCHYTVALCSCMPIGQLEILRTDSDGTPPSSMAPGDDEVSEGSGNDELAVIVFHRQVQSWL